MGEGCVDVRRLDREATARFGIGVVLDEAHQYHTTGNEQQHHAHIGCLRDEQVAEIIRFEHLFVQGFELVHTFEGGEVFGRGLPFAQPDFAFGQTERFFSDLASVEPETRNEIAVGDGSYIIGCHRLLCWARQTGKELQKVTLS